MAMCQIKLMCQTVGSIVNNQRNLPKVSDPMRQPVLNRPTFDRAVLLLDLDDSRRPRLARGLQGDARLVKTLLPKVVRAAPGAPAALRFIRVGTLISIRCVYTLHIHTFRPVPGVHFVNLFFGCSTIHAWGELIRMLFPLYKVGSYTTMLLRNPA